MPDCQPRLPVGGEHERPPRLGQRREREGKERHLQQDPHAGPRTVQARRGDVQQGPLLHRRLTTRDRNCLRRQEPLRRDAGDPQGGHLLVPETHQVPDRQPGPEGPGLHHPGAVHLVGGESRRVRRRPGLQPDAHLLDRRLPGTGRSSPRRHGKEGRGSTRDDCNATRPEVLTCQAMWEIIGRERYPRRDPLCRPGEFQTKANRRNPEMFYSLIKAHAMLFFMQRERCTIETVAGRILSPPSMISTQLPGSLRAVKRDRWRTGDEADPVRVGDAHLAVNQSKDVKFTIQQLQEKRTARTMPSIQPFTATGAGDRRTPVSSTSARPISFTDRTVVMDEERSAGVSGEGPMPTSSTMKCTSSGRPADRSGSGGTDRDDRTGPSGTTEHNGRITETARVKNSHETTTETGILTCTNKKYNNSTTNYGNHKHRAAPTGACGAAPSSSCEIRISGSEISGPSCCHPIPGPAPEIAHNPLDTGPPEPPDVPCFRVKNYKVLEKPEYP